MSTRRTAFALLTSTAIAASLAACGGGEDNPAAATSSAESSAAASPSASSGASSVPGRAGDITFAQQMIPHHKQAVQMSDMALRNGTASAKVKALASQISKAQAPEIATMTNWLKSWNAPVTSGMGDMGSMDGMMSGQQMSGLGAAKGAAFDKQWVTLMIAHHRGAVTMSNAVLKTTSTPKVKTLAQQIVTAQQAEIKTMQGMLPSA